VSASAETIVRDLERLVETVTLDDSEPALHWTCKSLGQLAEELNRKGHAMSHSLVADLLMQLGYSLPAGRETAEGGGEPFRNAQFQLIDRTLQRFLADMQPVISLDTKQRELARDFKNAGRNPDTPPVHGFLVRELGRDTPYGVDGFGQNTGSAYVDMDRATAASTVDRIRGWWDSVGQWVYPKAYELLITAGAGGSNAPRARLWRADLQKLADKTGLRIALCQLPPALSKWNRTAG
jgi:hypothetical protein